MPASVGVTGAGGAFCSGADVGNMGGRDLRKARQMLQAGSHGYLNTDPEMDAIFIASGYGVKPAGKLDKIQNIDVASTIADLLGVKLPGARGTAVRLK